MAIEIGNKGLEEVNLTIPQSASLAFTVIHKDEEGHVIDHSESDLHMVFQSKDGATTYDLSRYCTGTNEGISVSIPASFTGELPKGKLVWDMFATVEGYTFRVCYGAVNVIDTYSFDEV